MYKYGTYTTKSVIHFGLLIKKYNHADYLHFDNCITLQNFRNWVVDTYKKEHINDRIISGATFSFSAVYAVD